MRKILLIIALMGFVSQSGFSQMSRDSLIEARNKYESLTNSNFTNKKRVIIYLKGLGRDQSRDSKHSIEEI